MSNQRKPDKFEADVDDFVFGKDIKQPPGYPPKKAKEPEKGGARK